jgi:type IV pilus assembly protein PilN
MPRINLLPWREQQRVERKKAFGVGMAAAGLGALAVTGAGYLLFNQMIDAQISRNARLTSEIKVLDKQIEEINSLEQQKQQFIARMQIIEKLQRSRPEIVHVFDTFVKTIPDGTYLTNITQTDKRFKIQGVAQSATRVSAFMRSLEGSEWLKDAELEVYENKRENALGSDFTLYANQITTLSDADAPAAEKTP